MLAGRGQEPLQTRFRSDRVFHAGGDWYFHTRESIEVGPYENQFEAELEAGLLRELLTALALNQSPEEVIREFVLDSFSWGHPLSVSCTSSWSAS
ncbi:MAG: hypothetical protein KUG75_07985 [Pseudomonadales bacterium]|nr:hypothetical protein [Pseudomonadales bacterium]